MKNKKPTSNILTSGDISRIQAEIAIDTQMREEASERISANKARLDKHDAAVTQRSRTPAKPSRKAHKPVRAFKVKSKLPLRGNGEETPPQVPTKLPKGGGSVGIVLDVLRNHPSGLVPRELKKLAVARPGASKSLREHEQYIYSILDTLEERGEAEKGNDGKWRPTRTQVGASATTH